MSNPYDVDGPYNKEPFFDLDRPLIRAIAALVVIGWVTVVLLWLGA